MPTITAHQVAVVALCALVVWFVWRECIEMLLAWYSGAEPPFTKRAKVLLWSRVAIAIVAAVTAVATL